MYNCYSSRTMSVQAQYNDHDYKNWLRACLGLKYLKEGIVDFIDTEVRQIHAQIITNACPSGTCNLCFTNALIDRRHPKPCPNNVCQNIRKEIEKHHRYTRPCWENTDATKWCSDHWEIGKCFMAKCYSASPTAMETDCTALLSICINGKFLPPTITGQILQPAGQFGLPTDIFHKNRDARNALLHSGSMSISDAERQDYIDDMIKLLASYKTPVDHVTQSAIDKLNEVNSVDIDITPSVERSLLQSKLDAMTVRQTQLEGKVGEQSTECEQHKEHIQRNTESLVTLSKRLDELKIDSGKSIADMQRACKSLQARNESLHQRLFDVENRLNDVEAVTKKLDTMNMKDGPGIKGVQRFLLAKYKHDSLTVPISPILRTHGVNVDEIYTELIIREDLVHKPIKNAEVETRTSKDRVKTYQDVLYDGDINCKNIYVVGKAGMGKTTWSRKLLSTWVNAVENRDKQWVPNEDESILQEYPLVFYIALRHATADRHVMQMIEHQLFPDRPDLWAIVKTRMNTTNSSKCIVILDGLDEWTFPGEDVSSNGIPVKDPTWKCSTITTTRSWKLEQLQLTSNRIDRAVEIQGLDKECSDRLIDHVVSGLNRNTGQNKKAVDFKSQISPSVNACMQVPLLLTIFICLWYEGVQISKHLAETYTELMVMLIKCAEGDRRKGLFPKMPSDKLSEMKMKWSNEKDLPPQCLSDNQLFVTYLPFLLRLGKLAFNTLFSNNNESTLVFNYETIESLLPEDELELSLKIGILCQTKHPCSVLKQEFRLSFLHKTVQEFLAALYIVSGDNTSGCVDTFRSYCKDEFDVLDMENVLLFKSGLCPETARTLSNYIADMSPDASIHQVLLDCWEESKAVSTTRTPIYIKHHFWRESDCHINDGHNEATHRYLSQIVDKPTTLHIQSRYFLNKACEKAGTPPLDFSECRSLKTVRCNLSNVRILVPNSLEELTMDYYNQFTSSSDSVLDLSGCQSLKRLSYTHPRARIQVPNSLEEVTIKGYTDSSELVLDLSVCHSLRILEYAWSSVPIILPNSLDEITIDAYIGPSEWVLDLSGCQSLRILKYIQSCVKILVPTSLEEVTIDRYTESSEWVLDLSVCNSLRKLRYFHSCLRILMPNSVEEVIIYGYTGSSKWVFDLSECQSLRTLRYTDSRARILVPNSLEELTIKGYTGPTEWVMDLSGCQSLKSLDYIDSSVQIKVPNRLEEVQFDRYTGSTEWVLDLSGCQLLKALKYIFSSVQILVSNSLEEVKIGKYLGSPEWVLDLSGCHSLKNLLYHNSSVWIQVPNSLEELEIDGYTGPKDWVLDLSGCQSLRTLQYLYSEVRILVPNNLEELTMHMYAGHIECVCDLSECQSLKILRYTYSNARIVVPNSLEELTIKGYRGPTEWVMELSGCQSLKRLGYTDCSVRLQVPNSLEHLTVSSFDGPKDWTLDLSRCQSLRRSNCFLSSNMLIFAPERWMKTSQFRGCTSALPLHHADFSGSESSEEEINNL